VDNQLLIQLITESAKLEENVSKLYELFSKLYSEDAVFWTRLYTEEMNHKAIFERFLKNELPLNLFPEEIIESNLANLRLSNFTIENELTNFLSRHKKKFDAYTFASKMEEIAGEIHFQQAMKKDSDSESLFLIQRINRDDNDHKNRIDELIKNLQLEEENKQS
jgi:hypothetical protein